MVMSALMQLLKRRLPPPAVLFHNFFSLYRGRQGNRHRHTSFGVKVVVLIAIIFVCQADHSFVQCCSGRQKTCAFVSVRLTPV